ncbi:ABC transporter permease [Candidatus Enterococcus ferrettii]|uniref:MacB-like periplasmic core domain-containing protein n=1 Tax=Candidatus Enterococcus ferrettii TaxID=2815324 RepID=A0ABV0END4_9ENTE|nr:ABC transporter permease [Enterococcus sp. 665A]MBO1339067.1 ABC transporter permease [Enterococcus sp. 665A]
MTFIQHAFLNLKRNKRNDFFIGLLFFGLLLGFFCLLQVYAAVEHSLVETKKQTDTIVNVEPDFQKQEHVTNLNEADLQALNELPNVEESTLIGYTAVEISGITLEDGVSVATFSSGTISTSGTPKVSVTALDNASLKRYFHSAKKITLQGELPLEQGTCLVTEQFAKSNKLKLGDELSLGNGNKKLEIVGISSSGNEPNELLGAIFVNLLTNEFLADSTENSLNTVTVRLKNPQAVGDFKKELRKQSAFDQYQVYTDQGYFQIFETFISQQELLLNGAIAAGILSLFFMGLFYSQLFKRRGPDIFALRLMGLRPSQLVISNILEITLIALLSSVVAYISASFISESLVTNWLNSLRQTSTTQIPLITMKHAGLTAAEIRQLLQSNDSAKFLIPYFASFLLVIVGLTSRMIFVFGHYSFQLRRKT